MIDNQTNHCVIVQLLNFSFNKSSNNIYFLFTISKLPNSLIFQTNALVENCIWKIEYGGILPSLNRSANSKSKPKQTKKSIKLKVNLTL